jgi:hypothetical protein
MVPEAARPAIGGPRAQQFVCPRVWRSLAREDGDGSAYVQLVQGAGAQQLGAGFAGVLADPSRVQRPPWRPGDLTYIRE